MSMSYNNCINRIRGAIRESYTAEKHEVSSNEEFNAIQTEGGFDVSLKIISEADYNKCYLKKVGTLMFASDWYDCLHNVDLKKLYENPNLVDESLQARQIVKILIPTTDNKEAYKNRANPVITFKHAMSCSRGDDGAYQTVVCGNSFTVYDHPLGDCIIVVKYNHEQIAARAEEAAAKLLKEGNEKKAKKEVVVDSEKARTRNANKAKNEEKKRREEYEKRCQEAAIIRAAAEKKRQQAKKAKAQKK